MRVLQLAYGVLSIDCDYYLSPFIQELFRYIKKSTEEDVDVELLVGVPKFPKVLCPIKSIGRFTFFPHTKNKGNMGMYGGPLENVIKFKYPYLPLRPFDKILDDIWYKYLNIFLKRREIPLESYDLIHANFMRPPGYAASLIALKHKIPFVLTVHENPIWVRSNLSRNPLKSYFILKKADVVIRPSYHNLELLGRINRNIRVVPNGYDDELFKFREMSHCRKILGLEHDDIVILSVGGLTPIKGHIYSILALEKVIRKFNRKYSKRLLYMIAGDGPLYTSLRALIRTRNLENNVRLLGYIPHWRLPIYYCSSDIFILPSLYESFGISLLEAQAMGVPAIVTSTVGASYILKHTSGGIIVPPRDVKELARALETALEIKWDRREIASKVLKFSWRNIAKKIIQIYEELYNFRDS